MRPKSISVVVKASRERPPIVVKRSALTSSVAPSAVFDIVTQDHALAAYRHAVQAPTSRPAKHRIQPRKANIPFILLVGKGEGRRG
jgi:hypothetical protein